MERVDTMKKIHSFITSLIDWLAMINIVILAVALFVGVLARYVFSYSIPEIEVVRKFAIMWLVFLGSAIAVREDLHLKIDILTEYLSERGKRIKTVVVYFLNTVGIIILILVGNAALKASLNRREMVFIRFLSSPPSLAYYYSAFLVGSVFMLYYHLLNAKDLATNLRKEVDKK